MLGMQTGYPLYVVGSSTFGTQGGYIMPGLLMGLLQVGWMSVNTFVATTFVLTAFGSKAGPGSLPFAVIAAAWALGLGYVGAKGIQYVSRFALYLNFVPLLMILVVFVKNAGGASQYVPTHPSPYIGFMLLIQIVVGFFATAGAAGVDFGMNSRDARDVRWGGWVGILLAVLVAGGLPLLSVAGAHVLYGRAGFSVRFGHCANRKLCADCVLHVCGRLRCADVLFIVHRGQQPRDNDSGRASDYFDDGRRGGGGAARDHGSGGEPDRFVHDHRRILRTDLRRDGGGLLVVRKEMGRAERRNQFRGLWSVGSRIRGRHFALPADFGGDQALSAAGGGVQFRSRVCGVRGSGESGTAAKGSFRCARPPKSAQRNFCADCTRISNRGAHAENEIRAFGHRGFFYRGGV